MFFQLDLNAFPRTGVLPEQFCCPHAQVGSVGGNFGGRCFQHYRFCVFDRQFIIEINLMKDGFNIVVAIRPFSEYSQTDIDLTVRAEIHAECKECTDGEDEKVRVIVLVIVLKNNVITKEKQETAGKQLF